MSIPTEAQILDEIRAAFESRDPADAMTTRELATALGISAEAMRRKMPELIATGRFQVLKVRRPSWDGRMLPVPAVRLI